MSKENKLISNPAIPVVGKENNPKDLDYWLDVNLDSSCALIDTDEDISTLKTSQEELEFIQIEGQLAELNEKYHLNELEWSTEDTKLLMKLQERVKEIELEYIETAVPDLLDKVG